MIQHPPERFCVIISFLSHLAELLSALYIVSFTIQRYTAVHHPLRSVTQSHSSALISLLLILIFSLLFCTMISSRASYADCYEDLSLFWFIADAVVSFLIPSSLILIFNILIALSMREHSRLLISTQSILAKRRRSKSLLFNNQRNNTFLPPNRSERLERQQMELPDQNNQVSWFSRWAWEWEERVPSQVHKRTSSHPDCSWQNNEILHRSIAEREIC